MPTPTTELLDNRYRLLEELGKGGMGVVWKAQDLTLERTVAIKILRREILDVESQERLRREARAAAQLAHPHIVTIFDVVLGTENTYLVMQHLPGESLRTWQDRIDLSWTDVVELAMQLTAALIYSHAAGIVHRDLKPENVIVSEKRANRERGEGEGTFPYHVTLLDFGLAKPFEATRLTQSGIFVGTASYMSPEQVTGAAVDGRSDVYSLGVILFELVAKRRPFEGDSFQNILFRHVNEKPRALSQINSGVDPELEQIVMRCLEKAPDRRFPDAESLLAELERVGRVLKSRTPELVASSLAVATAPTEKPSTTIFIGRDQELRELRLRYQKAHMGESQLVMLSGDAGVGKTRLWQELASQLSDSGTLVLRGRFFEQSRSLPYQGFIELLEEHLRPLRERRGRAGRPDQGLADYTDLADELTRISPSLGEIFGYTGPSPDSERTDKGLIFETFGRVFIRMALRQPLLVVLEDLHWADLSVELLSFLYRRTGSFRILYLATYRPEALTEGHPISRLVSSSSQDRGFAVVPLKPLTLSDTQTLVESFVPPEEGLGRLARKIYEITEGNPFFVTEMMKSLLEKRKEAKETAGPLASQLFRLAAAESLPSTVRDVVTDRLMRLSDDLREILLKASVIGRRFSFATLSAIADVGEDELMRGIEKLIIAGIIQEEPRARGESFLFTSAIVREAVYRNLSSRRRRMLHQRVASILETDGVLGDPVAVFALADHYVQAGREAQAITYCIRAGELARRQASLDDAEGFYLTAKNFLEDEDSSGTSPRLIGVVRALGDIYRERGELSTATVILKESLQRLEANHAPEAAEVCLDLGRVYSEARHPGKAKEFVTKGLGLLGEEDGSQTAYGLTRLRADIASLEGEHRLAEGLHKKAERMSRGQKAARQFKQGGEIRLSYRDRPRGFDPHQATLQFDAGVLSAIWEPLLCYGYGTDLVPRLAERWDISQDAQHYHIHLREGLRFNDGRRLDAEDVLASLMRAVRSPEGFRLLEPIAGAREYRAGRSLSIEGIRILDLYTLEIALTRPISFFLSILTSVNLAIMPKDVCDMTDVPPTGTGPFMLDQYDPGSHITLKRNPHYHRPGFPNVEKVSMQLGVSPAERVAQFLEGKTHLLTDTIPEELRAVAAARLSHRVLRREVTSLATNYLLVQKRIAPFNDLRVRQALAHAVDRVALQTAWEKGLAIPATTLLPPDLLGYEQRDKGHRPRHDLAKALLKQAGYPTGFETEIAVRRASSLYRAALLAELKRQLEAIDVVLNVNSIPDEEYAAVVAEGDSPLLLQGWVADYPDPDAFFHSLFMSTSGRARAFLASPSLDALILDARAEVHQDERRRLYLRAEEYLRQEAVFIPLSHDREVVYFHPNLRGLSLRLMAPHVEIDRLWVAE